MAALARAAELFAMGIVVRMTVDALRLARLEATAAMTLLALSGGAELGVQAGERELRVLRVIEVELLRAGLTVALDALFVFELSVVRVLMRVTAPAVVRRESFELPCIGAAMTRAALERL